MSDSRIPRALVFLLMAAFAVRTGWAWVQSTDPASLAKLPDQYDYLSLGSSLLHRHELKFFHPKFAEAMYAFRTPGYPLFVALCGAKLRVIRFTQAALDTSTVLATYLLARRWLDRRGALLAAFAVTVNPFLIYFCGLILSETLFTAVLVWAMVLMAESAWVLGGFLLALGILVRPSAVALPMVMGIVTAFVNPRLNPAGGLAYDSSRPVKHWRWPLPVATTMLLLTAVVLVPWAARNYGRLGAWIWTTTNAGITAYDGFNPDATGASNAAFLDRMPLLRDMTEVERDRYLKSLAWEEIRANPRRAVELAGWKVARTWSPIPLSRDFGTRLYVVVGLVYSLPLDLLVLAGLWSRRLPRAAKVFLLMPAFYFTAVHAASVGSLRYRVVAEGPMAIVAAAARWPGSA